MSLYWTSPSNPQTPAPTQRTVISQRKLSTSPGVKQDGWDCSKSRKQKPRRRLIATRTRILAVSVLFIILYFVRSRFAWHVLAADIFVITPIFVLLSPSRRLQLYLHPQIIWFPILGTCVFGALVIWSRKRYFAYLEKRPASSSEGI